jgi:hypothetical protein
MSPETWRWLIDTIEGQISEEEWKIKDSLKYADMHQENAEHGRAALQYLKAAQPTARPVNFIEGDS